MTTNFKAVMTEYGVELSVHDTEAADEFDDFLNEVCDISTYIKPIDDGMIFGFGNTYSIEQVQALVEKFSQHTS